MAGPAVTKSGEFSNAMSGEICSAAHIKTRVTACYQAPSRAIARQLGGGHSFMPISCGVARLLRGRFRGGYCAPAGTGQTSPLGSDDELPRTAVRRRTARPSSAGYRRDSGCPRCANATQAAAASAPDSGARIDNAFIVGSRSPTRAVTGQCDIGTVALP
jgi:hypothetical protein